MSFEFGSTLYSTETEMCRRIAADWLSSCGQTDRADMLGILAVSTDGDLAEDATEAWGDTGAGTDELTAAFTWLRANLDAEFPIA